MQTFFDQHIGRMFDTIYKNDSIRDRQEYEVCLWYTRPGILAAMDIDCIHQAIFLLAFQKTSVGHNLTWSRGSRKEYSPDTSHHRQKNHICFLSILSLLFCGSFITLQTVDLLKTRIHADYTDYK